jgi:hypothetical protein
MVMSSGWGVVPIIAVF